MVLGIVPIDAVFGQVPAANAEGSPKPFEFAAVERRAKALADRPYFPVTQVLPEFPGGVALRPLSRHPFPQRQVDMVREGTAVPIAVFSPRRIVQGSRRYQPHRARCIEGRPLLARSLRLRDWFSLEYCHRARSSTRMETLLLAATLRSTQCTASKC